MREHRNVLTLILIGGTITLTILTLFFAAARPVTVRADNDLVRIDEVMAGANGDSDVQFVEIHVADGAQKEWGPQAGETVGRAMLVFFDAAGNQTGRYVFPGDPGGPGNSVLVATQAFADLEDAPTPDLIMPSEVMAISGKVCFRNNPHNTNATPVNLCLSYGNFSGDTEGAGDPADALPIVGASSLRRVQNLGLFGDATNNNADFDLGTPDPTNTLGQTFTMPVVPQVLQGEILFMEETFNGNGRTCGSCHRPEDHFGLKPETIAAMPPNDPLFIANFNLNTLVLTDDAQPSDLRGVIQASNGVTATVLTGVAARTYLVYGGEGMSGSVSDLNGNTGLIQSFALGDLDALEDPNLLKGGRALIKANIDGFDEPAVFRKTPHLLNLALTGPFGLSGEFTSLQDFSVGAVRQHNTRTLARVDGVDFRLPTADELVALENFQRSIFMPEDQDFSIDRFVTTEAQKRGRRLFFSTFADGFNCDTCHESQVLSGILNFNTNVQQLPINGPDGDDLPREPVTGPLREFNTPPLFGIKHTAPYFHDNSVMTLREAVNFYNGPEFQGGPNGFLVNPAFFEDPRNVDDLVAFLEALVVPPFDIVPQLVAFGDQPLAAGPSPSQSIVVTNSGERPLTVSGATLNAPGADHFVITALPPAMAFQEGESRTIQVAFEPLSVGFVTATLEMTVTAADETWAWGVALSGRGIAPQADLGVIQTVAPDLVLLGGPLTYTLVVSNGGPSIASGVTVHDALPGSVLLASAVTSQGSGCGVSGPDVTCDLETLEGGVTATVTLVVTPTQAVTLVNTASVTAVEADPSLGNNAATAVTVVDPTADLALSLAAAPESVLVGGRLTYTLALQNLGPAASSGAILSDTLPMGVQFAASVTDSGTDCETLGQLVTCEIGVLAQGAATTVTLAVTATMDGVWLNAAGVAGNEIDLNSGNNTVAVSATVNPVADLALSQSTAPDSATAGQPLTLTLTIVNHGPSAASGVTLSDTLPGDVLLASAEVGQGSGCDVTGPHITCELGGLDNGAAATVTLVITPTIEGGLLNIASVSGDPVDLAPGNNTVAGLTIVAPAAPTPDPTPELWQLFLPMVIKRGES